MIDITGIGSIAEVASKIIERFFPKKMDDTERAKVQLQVQEMLEQRENAVIEAQKAIMVAEMQQDDTFTKRARPTLVYSGLFFIFLVHVIFPIIIYATKEKLPGLSLPEEFWWAWAGACSIWILGRSAEKRGINHKLVGLITGGKRTS